MRTHGPACTIIDKTGPLYNAADWDHCMQYMLAVVLLKGSVIEAVDYYDTSPWATDSRVNELRAKIHLKEDAQFTADYHDQKVRSASSGITVFLSNGTKLDEVVVQYPAGHPYRKDTLQMVEEKFRINMSLMFSKDRVDEILHAVENDALRVHEFIDLFPHDTLAGESLHH